MSRFLMVDIGAGTMDVLYYDDDTGTCYKAVAKSPVLHMAERAAALTGDLFLTGGEMGGGPISRVLAHRAREAEVVMTASAAMTVHHDLERVRELGLRVIEDQEAEEFRRSGHHSVLAISDLDMDRIERIIEGFGVPFAFDVVGICAQDHGMPPRGVSHLDFRHNFFKEYLNQNPYPHALLFSGDELPPTFNRLSSIGKSARMLPAGEVYLMDSGMAAILGASKDIRAQGKERLVVLDVATSHTVAAVLEKGAVAAFFEYHTHEVTLDRLESLVRKLADGTLEHQRILDEGGHGAHVRKSIGFDRIETIIATGPKRRLLHGSSLPIVFGSPFGDNMMTGNVGLLEAVRKKKGLEPLLYL